MEGRRTSRPVVRQKKRADEPKAIRMGRHMQKSSDPILKRKTEKKVKEFYHNAKIVKKGERAKRRYEREKEEAFGGDNFYDRYFGGGDLAEHEQDALDDFLEVTEVDPESYFGRNRRHLLERKTPEEVEDLALTEKLEGLVGPLRGNSSRVTQREAEARISKEEREPAERPPKRRRPSSLGQGSSTGRAAAKFDRDVKIYEEKQAAIRAVKKEKEQKVKQTNRKRRDRARKNRNIQSSMAARIRYVSAQVEKMVDQDAAAE